MFSSTKLKKNGKYIPETDTIDTSGVLDCFIYLYISEHFQLLFPLLFP